MRGKPVTFSDFRGGVNTEAGPYNVGANQARDARNVVSTLEGSLKKRHGSEVFSTPPVVITSLYAGTRPDTSTSFDPPMPDTSPDPDPSL